jgi:hypothetical protein
MVEPGVTPPPPPDGGTTGTILLASASIPWAWLSSDEIDEAFAFVARVNEPTVLDQGGFERLVGIAQLVYLAPDGQLRPYLEPEEVAAAAAFLLGPDGRAVTGTPFLMDLGWTAR